ncbi:protein Mss2p, mitochondrial [Trichomonascus vanleenenianus]|uniref:Mss2p n=1 Tax=Trichomonascus vanleenenianus TaxID=2268995 RepID=UPI003ECB341C
MVIGRRWYSQPASVVASFEQLLPRNTLKKYLFKCKVPLSYRKALGILESCRDADLTTPVPAKVTGSDVMRMKYVLEAFRKQTGTISKQLVTVEENLVEKAAEMGDNTAIALLSGRILTDNNNPKEDRDHADKLLTGLMDLGYPIAFKVSGDLAYKAGHTEEAKSLYQLAVKQGISGSAKVECFRSIGIISMASRRVNDAREAFEQAVEAAESVEQVMDCHFYLAQTYENNRLAAKFHFQQAASQGLKEAFAPLGFLYLNYFGNQDLAFEWFDLGRQVGDLRCLVGLFDIYMSRKDHAMAQEILTQIKSHGENGSKALERRSEAVQALEKALSPAAAPPTGPKGGSAQPRGPSGSDSRWGF